METTKKNFIKKVADKAVELFNEHKNFNLISTTIGENFEKSLLSI